MKKILLDTSILLLPGMELKDIFTPLEQEFELLIPEACLKEIVAMSAGDSKKARAARLALVLIKQKNLKILPSTHFERADDELLRRAREIGAAIATVDKELKRRARKRGIEIINIKKDKAKMG